MNAKQNHARACGLVLVFAGSWTLTLCACGSDQTPGYGALPVSGEWSTLESAAVAVDGCEAVMDVAVADDFRMVAVDFETHFDIEIESTFGASAPEVLVISCERVDVITDGPTTTPYYSFTGGARTTAAYQPWSGLDAAYELEWVVTGELDELVVEGAIPEPEGSYAHITSRIEVRTSDACVGADCSAAEAASPGTCVGAFSFSGRWQGCEEEGYSCVE